MRIAALLFCLLVTPVFAASMKMETKEMTVLLQTESCTNEKILSLIEDQYRTFFRVADLIYRGKPLKACWMALPQSMEVLMVDETGDHGTLPMSVFKRVVEM